MSSFTVRLPGNELVFYRLDFFHGTTNVSRCRVYLYIYIYNTRVCVCISELLLSFEAYL